MTANFALDADADDQKLLAQVVGYYHAQLKRTKAALAYLRQRGVAEEALKNFRIGYADRTLGKKLPSKEHKAGRAIRSRLEALGIFRAGTGHEHFNGCVVFPIHAADGTGRIVDLYGRKLGKKLRAGTALDLFLNQQRQGVWNIDGLTAGSEVILCPSVFDALVCWSHGIRNVTCTFGADALTKDHLAAFAEFKVKRLLVTNEAVMPKLKAAGLECRCVQLPPGQSIESYALQADDPADALAKLLHGTKAMKPPALPAEPKGELTKEEVVEQHELPDVERPEEPAAELPKPHPAQPEPVAEVHDEEVLLTFGNRRYRVRGWAKNLSFDSLRVNLLVSNSRGLFVDTFDLYSARHRKIFTVQAAQELRVEEQTVKKDIGHVLLKLEELQEQQINATLQPNDPTPTMSEAEKDAALALLRDPLLLDRIANDFDIVGEPTNKLVGYLAAISRKLDEPLAVIIQSSSAAGKTSLMDAVLSFVPPEDLVKYSAMTGQSLFYMGETNLKHKILAIVEEEGAERASYALTLLQSEGELTIASTGKDNGSGRLVTQEYRVQGPVMIFLTTTSVQVDEELLNRCLVLTVNEDREQTKAIHQAQRRRQTLPGLLARQDRQQTLTLHRNAQRLLRPLLVANPYAEHLTFLDDQTRTRRDHAKYLTLIRAIALLHQHQRPVQSIEHNGQQVEYVEVTPDDIEMANRLAHEVLGRSLDELPPQTRCLLGLIEEMVTAACQQHSQDRADYRFSRRDVREHTAWGHTQLKVHLKRLEELEYLLVHRGGRGQSFVYELLYEKPPPGQQRFLARLIDVEQLRQQRSGFEGEKSGSGHAKVGVKAVPSQADEMDATLKADN